MREDIDIKKALIALGVFILLIIGLKFVILYIAFGVDDFDDYTIKTKYGDEFKISFDRFMVKSTVTPVNGQNPQSYFYAVVKFKPSEEDFVGLEHTSELTVYRLGRYTIFKDKDGWQYFNVDNAPKYPEVAQAVMKNLLCDTRYFSANIEPLLRSREYRDEAGKVIKLIKAERYDELTDYGLSEKNLEDKDFLDSLHREAVSAKG
ncbi:MAG: hypothetical protein K6F27_08360 [Ruminococcus sp.]|nr:hypothetical protein [Ruminococcus sp.]